MLPSGSQYWIFCFFAAAFLIKMPAFLVHGWMPDAYRAAPLPVLALLSGVLSKVGAYGFLRVVVLFGGRDATQVFGDTWEFDGTTWTMKASGGVSARFGTSMSFNPTSGRVGVLIDGEGAGGSFPHDGYAWDGTTWTSVGSVPGGCRSKEP